MAQYVTRCMGPGVLPTSRLQVYRIHVVTGLLCQDKRGDATSLPCYPVDDDGNPLTKDQFVEDSGPASLPQDGAEAGGVDDPPSTSSSIAARFHEGDAWTGSYTCQGRQWFRFRILRVLASSPGEVVFSATLAFRHIQASGLYRAVGRYSVMDRKLKLTAGYNDFDIVFGPFPTKYWLFTALHAPCDVAYLVTMVIGC